MHQPGLLARLLGVEAHALCRSTGCRKNNSEDKLSWLSVRRTLACYLHSRTDSSQPRIVKWQSEQVMRTKQVRPQRNKRAAQMVTVPCYPRMKTGQTQIWLIRIQWRALPRCASCSYCSSGTLELSERAHMLNACQADSGG